MERTPDERSAAAHRVAVTGELSVAGADDPIGTRLPLHAERDLVAGAGSTAILAVRRRLDPRVSLAVDACGAVQRDGSLWLTVTIELDPLPPADDVRGVDAWSTVLPEGGRGPFTLALPGADGWRVSLHGALEHDAVDRARRGDDEGAGPEGPTPRRS